MGDKVSPEVATTPRQESPASVMAELLSGSWRLTPPAVRLSAAELESVVRPLTGSGTAALAWWSVRHSRLRESAPGAALRKSYQTQSLQSALQEWEVEHVFSRLRSA